MSFIEVEDTPAAPAATNSLWVEKYRPVQLEDYIGNDLLKAKIAQYIADNDIPHLLFYGTAGTGKTTLAKLVTKAIPCDCLYLNASSENRIDDVRTKVHSFAANLGFHDRKIIILDECLDENTPVWVLRNGEEVSIPIRDVDDKRDLVKSYNVEKNMVEWMPFDLFDKGVQDAYEIELENGEVVVCTEDHKWYVEDGGSQIIVKTKDLHKYSHILSP